MINPSYGTTGINLHVHCYSYYILYAKSLSSTITSCCP